MQFVVPSSCMVSFFGNDDVVLISVAILLDISVSSLVGKLCDWHINNSIFSASVNDPPVSIGTEK